MRRIIINLKSIKGLIIAISALCLILLGEREIKTIAFVISLELAGLSSGFGAIKTLAKNDEIPAPIRDGLIFLGAQLCVGFCALGVYFLQF